MNLNRKNTVQQTLWVILFFTFQLTFAQNTSQDSCINVTTIGTFNSKKEIVGNFSIEEVYMINEYYISPESISEQQFDTLKGKKIMVTGILEIVEGETMPAKTSNDGTIYEPYKEPDKKFIIDPTFMIIYDSSEPVIEKK